MDQPSSVRASDAAATEQVVAALNQAHGLHFSLHSRCASGLQHGAWRLTDSAGRPAILKWTEQGSLPELDRRRDAVARLRAAGYPTPRWLATGGTGDGRAYHVQEFVPGAPAHPLTMPAAELFVEVLERHRGLDPDPAADRNAPARAAAYDESAGSFRASVRRLGPDGQALVDRYQRLLDRYGPVDLPGGDLVHGDFNTCNVLLDAGRVSGVIDVEALGSGTRVIDYACLLREAYVEDYDPAIRRMLHRAGGAVAGPGPLALCVTATALFIVGFKHTHQPAALPPVLTRLHRLADDLTRPPA